MENFVRDPGSFRDPAGCVFTDGQRILRGLSKFGSEEFEAARGSGLLDAACKKGLLIESFAANTEFDRALFPGARGEALHQLIEHPKIPLITYPYEWTFEQLRDAAMQHLDLQLLALHFDFELSDATAYNMQFDSGAPLHIDVSSLRRYQEGRAWQGYNQFCRQFLFPLLLESVAGLPFQRLYRGNVNGVELGEMVGFIPAWRRYSSLNLLMHVQMQSSAARRATSSNLSGASLRLPHIPKKRYRAMLEGLRDWIESLKVKRAAKTYWANYAVINNYSAQETELKKSMVEATVRRWGAQTVLDVGGNSGEYSSAALAGGARHVYCLDGDTDALEIAYQKRKDSLVGLLPIVMNWSDPSPAQGWAGCERGSLLHRMKADTVMALAVVHHIVIGGNVPLKAFVDLLFTYGSHVIVEFVPKDDPMVQGLLRGREDVFTDFTEERFVSYLEEKSNIEAVFRIREKGRVVFCCRRL